MKNNKNNLSAYLQKNLEIFYEKLNKENDRYNSWEYCYKFFQKLKRKKETYSSDDLDLASLNLAFYLASWGMYRGSSFLLQYDYKIFKPLIKELLINDICNNVLWDINIEKTDVNSYLDAIGEANRIITKCLKKYTLNANEIFDKNVFNPKIISETLITKILMGIYGCIPAYDRFFCDGINELSNKYNIKNLSGYYNKNSVKSLYEFIKVANCCGVWTHDNGSKYKLHNKDNNEIIYPIMKLVDMCFWQIGYNNSIKGIKVTENEIILMRNMRGKKDNDALMYKIDKIQNHKTELIAQIQNGNKIIRYSDNNSENININKEELIESINNDKLKLLDRNLENDIC